MVIEISTDEFEDGMKDLYDNGKLSNFSIDYATNAIHGWCDNIDCIIFKFKGYGFINDNRYNTYELINHTNGFKLSIKKT